jgi:hypothetical protein
MPRALLAAVFALAALASGCAGSSSSAEGFEGEEKKVAELVEKLQRAGETDEPGTICDEVLAKELRDQIQEAGSTCEQEMAKAIEDADDFELDVEDVTIDGDEATAKVRGSDQGEERVRDYEFVREGPDWRATSLG